MSRNLAEKFPLVSVIVPVYNVEKYLARCLDSIVEQTYQNLEIILINDGSTDGSGEICRQYAERDSRIRLFHQENRGQSVARNVGLDNMTGEYIVFVDSDDYISPQFVEILLVALLRSNVLIARCKYVRVADQEDNKKLGTRVKDIPCRIIDKMEVFDMFGVTDEYLWVYLYHKTIFKSLRFPAGKTWEDIRLFPELFWQIDKLCLVDISLYAYRQRPGSTTASGPQKDFFDARFLEIAFAQRYGLNKYIARIVQDLSVNLTYVDNNMTIKELRQYVKSIEDEVYRITGKRLISWRYLWFRVAPRSFRLVRKRYLKIKNYLLAHKAELHAKNH